MSLLYIDSFDGYPTAEVTKYWTSDAIVGSPTINTTSQRTGAGCMQPPAGGIQDSGFEAGNTTWVIGCAFKAVGVPIGLQPLFEMIQQIAPLNTATRCGLYIGADLYLHITNQFGVTIAVSTRSALSVNRWSYVEWFGSSALSGHHQIFIDGAIVFDGTLNTLGTGTINSVSNIQIGRGGGLFDDFYFATPDGHGVDAPIGDASIFARIPSGTGSFSQWTPNGSATNWQNVKNIPFTSADHNDANASNLVDSYKVAVISGSGSGVNGYTPSSEADNDVVSGVTLVQRVSQGTEVAITVEPFLVVAGGTFTDTGNSWTPNSFNPQITIYTTNPKNGAWTGTSVNATEWGIEHV